MILAYLSDINDSRFKLGHFTREEEERLNKAVDNLWPSINFIINGNYNFVLKPMNMLAPNFRHPDVKKTMAQLLQEL